MSTQVSEDAKAFMKSVNKIKTTKNVKPKKLSAYNLFCMENREKLTGTPTSIMTELGGMWKAASEAKKKAAKAKADKLNAAAVKEAEQNQVEDDQQTVELKAAIVELFKNFKKDLNKKKKAVAVEKQVEAVV
jgi:beta-phosphoglucomutase-like phosphatase (HAD superfamily)